MPVLVTVILTKLRSLLCFYTAKDKEAYYVSWILVHSICSNTNWL